MACRVRIQPTAQRELENTVEYLFGFGPNTAQAFLAEWESVLESLRDGLVEYRLSRFEPLAKLGYRSVLMKSYVVLYFKEKDDVVIAHLFHQSQDYANIVLNGE
jgi:plasmid stabilization system protein ParE